MPKYELIIDDKYDGIAVGKIIESKFKISARLLSKLKNTDGIKLNGEHITVRGIAKKGDVLSLIMPNDKSENIIPVNFPLDILYEDDELLIVNKQRGMPTHPSLNNFDNTLGNAVMYYYKDIDFVYRPAIRLDKDTTGIVVIAKTPYAHHKISLQLQNRTFDKKYLAICKNVPKDKEGIINAPIKREKESIIKRVVASDGQEAITHYKVIKEKDNLALVELILKTGRTHQIRVHLAHIGCPLLYDYLYGEEEENKTFLLHCTQVSFIHPTTNKRLTINCLPPEEFDIIF